MWAYHATGAGGDMKEPMIGRHLISVCKTTSLRRLCIEHPVGKLLDKGFAAFADRI